MVFRDLIKTGDGITPSNLRQGSLVGIYKGTLPEGKNISDYKDIEELKNKSGLTPIDDNFISQLNGTNELLLTAKDDIQLGNEKVYMIKNPNLLNCHHQQIIVIQRHIKIVFILKKMVNMFLKYLLKRLYIHLQKF